MTLVLNFNENKTKIERANEVECWKNLLSNKKKFGIRLEERTIEVRINIFRGGEQQGTSADEATIKNWYMIRDGRERGEIRLELSLWININQYEYL